MAGDRVASVPVHNNARMRAPTTLRYPPPSKQIHTAQTARESEKTCSLECRGVWSSGETPGPRRMGEKIYLCKIALIAYQFIRSYRKAWDEALMFVMGKCYGCLTDWLKRCMRVCWFYGCGNSWECLCVCDAFKWSTDNCGMCAYAEHIRAKNVMSIIMTLCWELSEHIAHVYVWLHAHYVCLCVCMCMWVWYVGHSVGFSVCNVPSVARRFVVFLIVVFTRERRLGMLWTGRKVFGWLEMSVRRLFNAPFYFTPITSFLNSIM